MIQRNGRHVAKLPPGGETVLVREIRSEDNPKIETIIRQCLIAFGADHAGTAWADPDLGRFSEVYSKPGRKYWVAQDDTGQIVGGVGIGEIAGEEQICELQKMYCIPEVRGMGISHRLMDTALDYAAHDYTGCYLETLENMVAAQRFYEKYGFRRLDHAIGRTTHFACDVRYFRELKKGKK